jgi:hypothetical protein
MWGERGDWEEGKREKTGRSRREKPLAAWQRVVGGTKAPLVSLPPSGFPSQVTDKDLLALGLSLPGGPCLSQMPLIEVDGTLELSASAVG